MVKRVFEQWYLMYALGLVLQGEDYKHRDIFQSPRGIPSTARRSSATPRVWVSCIAKVVPSIEAVTSAEIRFQSPRKHRQRRSRARAEQGAAGRLSARDNARHEECKGARPPCADGGSMICLNCVRVRVCV